VKLKDFYKQHDNEINKKIVEALSEDKITKDVTTLFVQRKIGLENVTAVLLCKEDCVLCGTDIFVKVLKAVDKRLTVTFYKKETLRIRKGEKVCKVSGSFASIFKAERTALNFIQRMSGVATLTNQFVMMLKYKNAKILHTRKTTPGFRVFELAGVLAGGGNLHRTDLSSAVMLKDNHIESAGSIKKLLSKPIPKKINRRFEIEVKSLAQVKEVIQYGKGNVEIVMLDNFQRRNLIKAISLLKANGFKIELSGGINLKSFSQIQHKGVDYYSVGLLTHGYNSVDFSLEFNFL